MDFAQATESTGEGREQQFTLTQDVISAYFLRKPSLDGAKLQSDGRTFAAHLEEFAQLFHLPAPA